MAYENLLRRILLAENQPRVLMMYSGGKTPQKNEIPLGRHYAHPMVSYNHAVIAAIFPVLLSGPDHFPDPLKRACRAGRLAAPAGYAASPSKGMTVLPACRHTPPAVPACRSVKKQRQQGNSPLGCGTRHIAADNL